MRYLFISLEQVGTAGLSRVGDGGRLAGRALQEQSDPVKAFGFPSKYRVDRSLTAIAVSAYIESTSGVEFVVHFADDRASRTPVGASLYLDGTEYVEGLVSLSILL